MKQCTSCKMTKPYSNFHKMSKSRDGYKYTCKDCVRAYDKKENEPKRILDIKIKDGKSQCRWCKEYLESSSFINSKTYCVDCSKLVGHTHNIKRYNLTPNEYIDMSNAQNNVCKICGNKEEQNKRLSIDHDHACCNGNYSCGKCVRGLLCSRCNKCLGILDDDKSLLQKMIDYLR